MLHTLVNQATHAVCSLTLAPDVQQSSHFSGCVLFSLRAFYLRQVWGALYVLRVLTRKYEFKDEDERAPLAPVVTAAFPPLLAMLQVCFVAQGCGAKLSPGIHLEPQSTPISRPVLHVG